MASSLSSPSSCHATPASSDATELTRLERYALLQRPLVDEWHTACELVQGVSAAHRTLSISGALSPVEPLFPQLPAELLQLVLSFALVQESPDSLRRSASAVCRSWARALSAMTLEAAQAHIQCGGSDGGARAQDSPLITAQAAHVHSQRLLSQWDHSSLQLLAASTPVCTGKLDPAHPQSLWHCCMCGVVERITLQLVLSSGAPWCSRQHQRHLLVLWLSRIALTLPGVDSELAARIFLRSVSLGDQLPPSVALPLHYLCCLLLVSNATLLEPHEDTLALTSAQAAVLLDGACSEEDVRAASNQLLLRIVQFVQGSDSQPQQSAPAATPEHSLQLLRVTSPAELSAAVWCVAADVLARMAPELAAIHDIASSASPASATAAAASATATASPPVPPAAAFSPPNVPCALWFTPLHDAAASSALGAATAQQPTLHQIRVEQLCCNLEARSDWHDDNAVSIQALPAVSHELGEPLLARWPPLLQHVWSVRPSAALVAAVLNCCCSSPALLNSSILPAFEFTAPFMKPQAACIQRLQRATWCEALQPFLTGSRPIPAATSAVALENTSVSTSMQAPKAAASSTRAPPSKARWGLLKRALVKSAPAGDDAASSGGSEPASVRRHAGFKVLQMSTLQGEDLARWSPPTVDGAAKDANKYLCVRYDLPSLRLSTSSADASPSPPLLFRLRRPDSIQLSELAPGQKIDNTGNVCIWNSEEVLAHVALKLLMCSQEHGAEAPGAADASSAPLQLPPSLFARPSVPGRPLRILELGAGMSGLCGIALAAAAATVSGTHTSMPALSEVMLTDGNTTCVDSLRFQVAWNQLHALSQSDHDDAVRVSARELAWDRNADYSLMGKFDVILVADCLFFRAFHEDLLHVLRSLLVVDTGRAWMLAPGRGGSLDQFVALLHRQGESAAAVAATSPSSGAMHQQGQPHLRLLHKLDRYDETIWQQHQVFLQEEERERTGTYAVDLHYPLLLSIQLASSAATADADMVKA